MSLDTITLSAEQEAAVQAIRWWWTSGVRRSPVFTVSGFAGVGKSTVIDFAIRELGIPRSRVTYAAYTGKAALVLRRKGLPARTLHSLMYIPEIENGKCVGFTLREFLEGDFDLVVVDEVSMVNARQMRDLVGFGVPVLALGDPAQLPPVKGEDCGLLVSPDVFLKEIHRQALDNPIVWASMLARQGKPIPYGVHGDGRLKVIPIGEGWRQDIHAFDQAITCKINSRDYFNNGVRTAAGYLTGLPALGEKVISRKNKWDQSSTNSFTPLVNGLMCRVVTEPWRVEPECWSFRMGVACEHDPDSVFGDLVCNLGKFQGLPGEQPQWADRLCQFEYGYAITAHLCVHPETLVETPLGVLSIKDIPSSGAVATPTGVAAYHSKFSRPSAPALKITTKSGYSLTVSPEHGLTTWDGQSHVRVEARDLGVDGWLRLRLGVTTDVEKPPALPEAPPIDVRAKRYSLPTEITADLAELLGLLVADGTLFRAGYRVRKRYQSVVDRFSGLNRMIFGANVIQCPPVNGIPAAEVQSTQIAGWLRLVGGMDPNQKHVPDVVLRSPLAIQAAFLRGLFEDGGVNVKEDRVDHIEWTNVSHDVVGVVQTLLLRFGIVSCRRARKTGYGTTVTSLYLYGLNAKRFRDQIGFVAPEKNARLANARFGDESHYVVPVTKDEVNALKDRLTLYSYQNGRWRGSLSRHTLTSAVEQGPAPQSLVDKLGWHYERIAKVETLQCETMCITVPDGNRFLQNGFDGWNSQGGEWDRVLVCADLWGNAVTQQRLLYTAITRAAENLVLAI